MGGCFSSGSSTPTFTCIRVIHINGYVEDFEPPITVGQVTGKPPKHVLCSAAHLLTQGSLPYFRPNDPLQPGRLYFLLPHAVFQTDTSAASLSSLAARLTAMARSGSRRGSVTSASGRLTTASGRLTGPVASLPTQLIGPVSSSVPPMGPGELPRDGLMTSRARTWFPELTTIEERSIERSMGRDSSASSGGTYM